ncbi:hypothetical protein ONZ45_g5921 [Pleurotus djamor]|nr:hypothetical protein ONZ45_g5921 [Pleurotus djamor]
MPSVASYSFSQRTLEAPELRHLTFAFLDARDLLACGLVCKDWFETAMGLLWQEVTSLKAVLKNLCPLVRGERFEAFSRALEPQDWTRFQRYANRVRVFRPNDCGQFDLKEIGRVLKQSRSECSLKQPIFPALAVFVYSCYMPLDLEFAKIFWSQSIAKLTRTDDVDDYGSEEEEPEEEPEEKESEEEKAETWKYVRHSSSRRGNASNLQEVTVSAPLEHVISFLKLHKPQKLTKLNIRTPIAETPTSFASLFITLKDHSRQLTTLHLKHPFGYLDYERMEDSVTFEHLKPLLSLKKLTSVKLYHFRAFCLSKAEVVRIVKGLPCLTSLYLNERPLHHDPHDEDATFEEALPASTLVSLSKFGTNLTSLGLYFDPCSKLPKKGTFTPFKKLAQLSVGRSPLPYEDEDSEGSEGSDWSPLVAFMSQILPKGCNIDHDFANFGQSWSGYAVPVANYNEEQWDLIIGKVAAAQSVRREGNRKAK